MMNSNEPAVVVKNLHKSFLLPHQRRTSLKQVFVNIGRKNYKTKQKVLDGVDFTIEKGEFFGIVGRNGCGKSTLLKILAGVYMPSSGTVAINGELTPFIELGVGFNPELSGRDNVFLNGALLGFSKKEMATMYDDIVQFAELEQFMDQKLKNYSSGMQVRLAFAIAIKAHNDILIFDEVLAVGDEAFQRKCIDVFEQYRAQKQTVVLVTHDMATVRQFCTRAMLLDKGKIVEIGNPRKVATAYSALNQETIDDAVAVRNTKAVESNIHAQICGVDDEPRVRFGVGEHMRIVVTWEGLVEMQSLGVNIFKESGEHVTGANTRFGNISEGWQKKQKITLNFDLDITKGKYFLLIESFGKGGQVIDALLDGPHFSVVAKQPVEWSGLVDLPHSWS